MKKSQIIFLSIILVFASIGNLQAQTKVFSEAKGSRAANNRVYDYEKWNFSIGEDKYEINKSGCGKKTEGNNSVNNFCFSIEGADYIDRVIYFAEHKNDLLLVGELFLVLTEADLSFALMEKH